MCLSITDVTRVYLLGNFSGNKRGTSKQSMTRRYELINLGVLHFIYFIIIWNVLYENGSCGFYFKT